MAYHYRESGFTPIKVGRFYARYLQYYNFKYRLKRYNPATGICAMASDGGGVHYVSAIDLSHWHIIGEGTQL